MSLSVSGSGFLALIVIFSALSAPSAVNSADWIHWRGPEQNGESKEKNLPADFDPAGGPKSNVIWKAPFGGRASPLILDGRAYIMHGAGENVNEGEEVMCIDAETGKKLHSYKFNVFHTDIVSVRLGWTTLTADPATKTIYIHSTAGLVIAFDKDLKPLWQRSLTEEFGRVSGYGGRIVSPIFDSGLVIVGMINSSWGDQARGGNRYVALDGKTGEVVWWGESPLQIKGTYYSNSVIAVIKGQRLLITGGGDGCLQAYKVRTGERVWSHLFSAGVVNPSPVVDGNLVFCSHGEENPEGGPIGRVICVDASQIDPKTKTPKVVWDSYGRKYAKNRNQPLAARFGLASPALAEGKLYVPDDGGELYCFDAKTGEMNWKVRYATEVRGAPLVADGKLYIFDVKARMWIMELNKDRSKPPADEGRFEVSFPSKQAKLSETNGTPIAVNGKVYFNTRNEMYCLGLPDAKKSEAKYKTLPEDNWNPNTPSGDIASLAILPADVVAKPGETITFSATALNEKGHALVPKFEDAEWSLPMPPKTPTGAQPPALNAKIGKADNAFTSRVSVTLAPQPTQQGYVEVKLGKLTARARVRVAAQTPYAQDFEKLPVGAVPGGWVNATGKYTVVEKNGNKMLSKVNTDSRPPIARANAYITPPTATGYTIQADVMGTEVRKKVADIGVVANRYTLILDGKADEKGQRELRLVSWEARPRVNVGADFNWKPDVWYTIKLSVDVQGDKAIVRGKAWEKDKPEPAKWTIEFTDPSPNKEGAAALYGYVSNVADPLPGSEIFYDNVKITPNGNKSAQK